MKLNKLFETLGNPPRSEVSTRIIALMDKTKLVSKSVEGTKLEPEMEKVNELIDRAKKNKHSTLALKILQKAEEHINAIIFAILKRR